MSLSWRLSGLELCAAAGLMTVNCTRSNDPAVSGCVGTTVMALVPALHVADAAVDGLKAEKVPSILLMVMRVEVVKAKLATMVTVMVLFALCNGVLCPDDAKVTLGG